MTSGDMVIPSIQIGLLGTLSTLLQSVRTDHSKKIDMRRLQTILATVCKMLLQTTRELPSVQELKKLREGQDGGAGSFVNTDHRIKGGEALSLAGLTGYVCLPISYCYQNGDTSIQGPTPNQDTSIQGPTPNLSNIIQGPTPNQDTSIPEPTLNLSNIIQGPTPNQDTSKPEPTPVSTVCQLPTAIRIRAPVYKYPLRYVQFVRYLLLSESGHQYTGTHSESDTSIQGPTPVSTVCLLPTAIKIRHQYTGTHSESEQQYAGTHSGKYSLSVTYCYQNQDTSIQGPTPNQDTSIQGPTPNQDTSIQGPTPNQDNSIQGPTLESTVCPLLTAIRIRTPVYRDPLWKVQFVCYSLLSESGQQYTGTHSGKYSLSVTHCYQNLVNSIQGPTPNLGNSIQGPTPNQGNSIQGPIRKVQFVRYSLLSESGHQYTGTHSGKYSLSVTHCYQNQGNSIQGPTPNQDTSIQGPTPLSTVGPLLTAIRIRTPVYRDPLRIRATVYRDPLWKVQFVRYSLLSESDTSIQGPTPNLSNSMQGPTPNQDTSIQGPTPNQDTSIQGPTPNQGNSIQGPTPNQDTSIQGPTPNQDTSIQGPTPNQDTSIQGPTLESTVCPLLTTIRIRATVYRDPLWKVQFVRYSLLSESGQQYTGTHSESGQQYTGTHSGKYSLSVAHCYQNQDTSIQGPTSNQGNSIQGPIRKIQFVRYSLLSESGHQYTGTHSGKYSLSVTHCYQNQGNSIQGPTPNQDTSIQGPTPLSTVGPLLTAIRIRTPVYRDPLRIRATVYRDPLWKVQFVRYSLLSESDTSIQGPTPNQGNSIQGPIRKVQFVCYSLLSESGHQYTGTHFGKYSLSVTHYYQNQGNSIQGPTLESTVCPLLTTIRIRATVYRDPSGKYSLSVTHCYQNQGNSIQGPTLESTNKQARQTPQPVTWLGVYCQCVDLYTTLLTSLKFTFLEDAFNFVGSHQDRMQQCLECSRFNLKPEIFEEVERTCVFVGQLANYSREWRLHLPEPLNKILTSMLFMCQTFVSYLVRPRYLQYILEQQGGEKQPGSRGGERFPVATLHTQASMEDVDNPSTQYTQVQHSLLKVIGESLVALRRFTPDLVQILVDQLDGGRSPQRSDQASASSSTAVAAQQISKSLVMFVLENALYLTMSQGMWYLKDPRVHQRDKQLLKRELGTEMNSILSGIQRYIRRGGPQSPAGGSQPSPRGQSPGGPTLSRSVSQTFLTSHDHAVFRLVQEFSKQVLR
ncbi:NU188-like protein [Mya arenaria]|uniref:NU188-like protein n=1 Tax=Mya arenaria TaxID=6604 RepID=A0ABY7GCV1_MYAAR|nr:NU188-like protein [Mya arenaria]